MQIEEGQEHRAIIYSKKETTKDTIKFNEAIYMVQNKVNPCRAGAGSIRESRSI